MQANLNVKENGLGSSSFDRKQGRFALMALETAARGGNLLAEGILRAHSLGLGGIGMQALAEAAALKGGQAIVRLRRRRHDNDDYILSLPNVWIDLPPEWHIQFRQLLSNADFCKRQVKEWEIIHLTDRVRDYPAWICRILEACLLDHEYLSPLLIKIANFRAVAALPGDFRTAGEIASDSRDPIQIPRSCHNELRSILAKVRLDKWEQQIPNIEDCAEIDDVTDRLVSLLLCLDLDKSVADGQKMLSLERVSRAQEEIIRAALSGKSLAPSELLYYAWSSAQQAWIHKNIHSYFRDDERLKIAQLFSVPAKEILSLPPPHNAGKFDLVSPACAISEYQHSIDPSDCSPRDAAMQLLLILLCRCGCRASDLYSVNSEMIHASGSVYMTITPPFTKTTGRRTLPIGICLTPQDRLTFDQLLRRLELAGNASSPWFEIITGRPLPHRSQYDYAYSVIRREIAPPNKIYLPTHVPRHSFATSMGLWYTGHLLGSWNFSFFRLWTDDPAVRYIRETPIPATYSKQLDVIHLTNQIMGHKTSAQFVGTYCHAWPLILAAAAEANRPGRIPWHKVEEAFLSQ